MPPLCIKVHDKRAFGRRPVVGVCRIPNLFDYKIDAPTRMPLPVLKSGTSAASAASAASDASDIVS